MAFNLQTKKTVRITFQKFVKFVIHEIQNKLVSYGTYHWMPYSDFCGLCSIDYHFIGKLESMRTDLQHLQVLFHDRLDHQVLDIFDSKKNSSPGLYKCYEHDSAVLKSNFFQSSIILKDIMIVLTKGNLISHAKSTYKKSLASQMRTC